MAALPTTIQPLVYNSSKDRKARVRSMTQGDGYSQRASDGINYVIDEWTLEWAGSTSEIDELDDFFEARGGWESFTWTPPRESSSKKFSCVSWSRSYMPGEDDRLTANLKQEFDL